MESLLDSFENSLAMVENSVASGETESPIEFVGLDLHIKLNGAKHRTDRFAVTRCGDNSSLVVRRGQVVKLSFNFNRTVNWSTDEMSLVFVSQGIGDNEFVLPINGELTDVEHLQQRENGWLVGTIFEADRIVSLGVQAPVDSPIGLYKLRFHSQIKSNGSQRETNVQGSVYVLFNPWQPEDAVYMKDEALRGEYVLNEYGKVYQGTHEYPIGKVWHYGQFDPIVLPTISYLVELGKIHVADLRSPVSMVRHVSALVDQTDDQGILRGRWDGDYSDGVSPMTWSSSPSILEMYMRRGGAPVFYGQCWVYAAIVTTICRAMGVPCRPVTNFESAHDTDGNMNVDSFSDENGTPLDGANKDSSWNFHLWNEGWMTRTDLGPEFDGWQAFDATPQEKSEGRYQTGPSPVKAIQAGRVDALYDTRFIFAETNALFYDWVRDSSEPNGWKVVFTNREAGMLVLTKTPGLLQQNASAEDAMDITSSYKCNNAEARQQLLRHGQAASSEDVQYELVKLKRIKTGDAFDVVLNVKNLSTSRRTVNIAMSVASLEYTGSISKYVKREKIHGVQLDPLKSLPCTIQVTLNDYQDKITSFGLLKVMAGAKTIESQKTWAGQFAVKLEMPRLNVTASRNPALRSEILYGVSFINPLNIPLTDCELVVTVPGVINHHVVRALPQIPARGEFKWQGKVIFTKVDAKHFIITFNSNRMSGVEGMLTMVI